MPSSCGMFVYSDVTSAVTKIAFSGRGGRDSRSCRKCLLSRLYRVVESLWSAPIWIFMSRKDISWVECSKVNLIVGWRLFMKSFMDWSCLVVPMKIRKMSSMNLFQKGIAQMKASRMVSS